jgi:uncharacterized RDD family membrane protein YckC
MLGRPAGWYRDPAPRDRLAPDTKRYWDGTAWTAQTRTGSKRERRAWRAEAAADRAAYARDLVQRAEAGDEEAQWQLAAAAPSRRTTPDGQRLAGWWVRFAARFLDGWLVTIAGCLVAWPFLQDILVAVQQFVARATQAAEHGRRLPGLDALAAAVAGPVLVTTVVFVALNLAYEVGFLKGCAATPGKLVLGLRVRPGDDRGSLTWRAVFLRWAGRSGAGLVQVLPFGAVAYVVYALLDSFWPLGDRHRQALHDKLARTYVVRRV